MRRFNEKFLIPLLLVIPLFAIAADQPAAEPSAAPPPSPVPGQAGPDTRYPVPLTTDEALRQKGEMRNNLAALRNTLTALADKDFAGVESSLRRLAHEGSLATRPGVSTTVFRQLEREFEANVNKTIEAARSQNVDVVLRSLSDTMAFCQSCHMAFRQSLQPRAEPAPPQ